MGWTNQNPTAKQRGRESKHYHYITLHRRGGGSKIIRKMEHIKTSKSKQFYRRPAARMEKKWKKPQKVTNVDFRGCCSLCLAFDCKGHVTNHQRWPISYLHAKFELNRSINTKVTFLKATAAFIWPLIVKAAAPTLTLKVLINFGVGLVTGY